MTKLVTGAGGCTSSATASALDGMYGPVGVDVVVSIVKEVGAVVVTVGSPTFRASSAVTP